MDDQLGDWRSFLVDRHLDPMTRIVESLGDDLAGVVPALPGANSAYQILFHSCGMLEWWTRQAILGEPVDRDRAAEFTATGDVATLTGRVEQVRRQLLDDLARIDLDATPAGTLGAGYAGTAVGRTARGVLLHVLEELAQHHGHLEITSDVVSAGVEAPGR